LVSVAVKSALDFFLISANQSSQPISDAQPLKKSYTLNRF
jgi:hypothetical protein